MVYAIHFTCGRYQVVRHVVEVHCAVFRGNGTQLWSQYRWLHLSQLFNRLFFLREYEKSCHQLDLLLVWLVVSCPYVVRPDTWKNISTGCDSVMRCIYILIDYDTSFFVMMLSGTSRYWTEKVEPALPRRNAYFQKDMSCLAVIGDWKYVIFLCHNLCGSPCVQSVLEPKNRFKLS